MKPLVLNLSEGFNPFDKDDFEVERFVFNGGEPHIKIKSLDEDPISFSNHYVFLITCRVNNMNDLITVGLAVDAINRMYEFRGEIHLFIPYLPFARQDRVMVGGEPLSIKVLGNFINSLNVNSTTCLDVHSNVAKGCFDNLVCDDNYDILNTFFETEKVDINDYVIVSPDTGAKNKIFPILERLKYVGDVAICDKRRDLATGKITGTTCSIIDFEGKNVLIVDDICDGGMTFIKIAELLKQNNVGTITLFITHGIFSKGFDVLYDAGIDVIVTSNSISSYNDCPHKETEKLIVIAL